MDRIVLVIFFSLSLFADEVNLINVTTQAIKQGNKINNILKQREEEAEARKAREAQYRRNNPQYITDWGYESYNTGRNMVWSRNNIKLNNGSTINATAWTKAYSSDCDSVFVSGSVTGNAANCGGDSWYVLGCSNSTPALYKPSYYEIVEEIVKLCNR